MKKYLVVLACLIIMLVAAVSMWIRRNSGNVRKTDTTKEVVGIRYVSGDMPVSFIVPKNYTSEVKNYLVTLHPKDSDETISIERIATNFDDAGSYLDDLARMNKMSIVKRRNIFVHSVDLMEFEYVQHRIRKRMYVIVRDGWAYTIDSSSPILNDDLDAVAQSLEFSQ